jgi:RsmE family RNA methyltransferase
VTVNLILLFKKDFVEKERRVRLAGRRYEHLLRVHRASVGDGFLVGELNGRVGAGTVVVLDGEKIELDVRFEQLPPPKLPLVLALALPRPKVLRRVLRTACSMGVEKIVLFNSLRVEKSFWKSPFLAPDAVQEQLVLGLEQAKDTVLPEVLLRPLFRPFVEDELPGLVEDAPGLVAHPNASEECPRAVNRPATLIIGPEGGFIPYEIEKLVSAGCRAVRAGERILSVETAVPALIARLF